MEAGCGRKLGGHGVFSLPPEAEFRLGHELRLLPGFRSTAAVDGMRPWAHPRALQAAGRLAGGTSSPLSAGKISTSLFGKIWQANYSLLVKKSDLSRKAPRRFLWQRSGSRQEHSRQPLDFSLIFALQTRRTSVCGFGQGAPSPLVGDNAPKATCRQPATPLPAVRQAAADGKTRQRQPGTTVRTNSVRRAVSRYAQGVPALPPARTPGPDPQRRSGEPGSQTPALSKGRARQGVPDDRLQGRLDEPQDGWSGWRLDGVSGLRRPRISPPAPLALRDWTPPEGRRRGLQTSSAPQMSDRGLSRQAAPLPGTPCLKPASGLLTPLTAAGAGRAACPSRPPRPPASGRALPARWQRGRRREGDRLADGTSIPLPAGKAMLVLGKQGQHALRLRDKAGFSSSPVPCPVQSRSRPAPEFLHPLGSPSKFPRKPCVEPRTASDRAGQGWASPGQCRLKFVLFQTVPKKKRRHWTSRLKSALPPPSAGPADPCGKRTHAESGRGEASGSMGLAHGAQAPPEAGRRCSSSLQSLAPQASARARP